MVLKGFSRFCIFLLLISLPLSSCRQSKRAENSGGESPMSATAATTTSQSSATIIPDPTLTRETLTFQTGRNDYVIDVDGFPREFLVYVPAAYDASQPTPLVFMFHGSNQGGPLMFENTRWVQEADENNILVVFPTAWKYPLIGEGGLHTKWNDVTLTDQVEPGTELRDDVHFVRVMLERMSASFNVDSKRIYATGFSNGGSFVSSRLLIQMSDTFGAFAICGSGVKAVNGDLVSNVPAGIHASLYSIVGTNDEKIAERTGRPRPFPIDPSAILADELFGPTLTNTAQILSLDPSQYQLLGNNPKYTVFLFDKSTVGSDNEYIFQMVDGMGHVYPSVDNNRHQLNAANIFWEFFMRHPLK